MQERREMLTFAAAKNGGLAQLARAPALHAGGQRFESVILHNQRIFNHSLLKVHWRNGLWHDVTSKSNFSTKAKSIYHPAPVGRRSVHVIRKVGKGAWRMPWLSEAMKDVISCDKLRGGANNLWSADFRMGQPNILKRYYPSYDGGERRELKHLSTCRNRK